LIVITDCELVPKPMLEMRVRALLARARPGSVLVQLRDPTLSARERLDFGQNLLRAAREHAQYFAVNDRLDLARVLRADAVHLGEGSVDAADARVLLGPIFISRACHDPRAALTADADAVLLSPIFAARKQAPALGLARLRLAIDLARSRPKPPRVYALGGVTAEHAARALAAGADGVAAIGAALAESGSEALLDALGIRRT
jgi:thiamine-phosphate pyrophosphorylase